MVDKHTRCRNFQVQCDAVAGQSDLLELYHSKALAKLTASLASYNERLALEEALKDLLDGQGASDIRDITGLPEERCKELAEIHENLPTNTKLEKL